MWVFTLTLAERRLLGLFAVGYSGILSVDSATLLAHLYWATLRLGFSARHASQLRRKVYHGQQVARCTQVIVDFRLSIDAVRWGLSP
jgi:hypothetical protein